MVDQGQIRVAVVGGQVHVIGEAGAVSPGGISVTVTNQETNASVTVASETDGSFDVAVAGDANDGYSVKVKGAAAVIVTGTVAKPPEDGDCDTANEKADAIRAVAEASAAEVGCEQDSDCTLAPSCRRLGYLAVPHEF